MTSSTIGKESYCVSELKNVDIGSYTSIAGGCVFHSNDNHAWIQNKHFVSTFPFNEKWSIESYPCSYGKGHVKIGNDVWVGEGCRFLSGITVGDGAIVAAGSVVSKDVPPYAMVAGNPARVKYYRFPKKTIKKLLQIKWWDWDPGLIRQRIDFFQNINGFIQDFS